MKQVLQNNKTGELKVEEVPHPILMRRGVLARNEYSLISKGTERTKVDFARKSTVAKAKSRPDLVKQVLKNAKKEGWATTFKKVMNKLESSSPLGYSSAGEVMVVGDLVEGIKVGDKVACAGAGYANHAEIISVPVNLCAKIPENVSCRQACFTTLGAIALQGIRQAQVNLGENVAVIGLGILGQLTVQMLKASGCQVFGMDIDEEMVNLAKNSDADSGLVIGKEDVASKVINLTCGHGVDVVIITAGTTSNEPIELAGDICRDKGRVVIVGAVNTDVPRKNFYDKELDLRFSRSYGPGRYDHLYEEMGIDYPFGYVRWTEKRNMEEFLNLLQQGKVNTEKLVTHEFKVQDAEKAYDLIMKGDEKSLAVLLKYEPFSETKPRIYLKDVSPHAGKGISAVNIGFIGAGNFANNNLLPHLKKMKEVKLKGVVTSTGISAKDVARKFGFEYCSSDVGQILEDEEINCIFIATRHNLHSPLVCQALKAGKAVFVEKPLATSEVELEEIKRTLEQTRGRILVGFNRRFSPACQLLKKHFQDRTTPLVMTYRVNAGFIPASHWIHDPEEGGGRIIGEVCHFVDLLSFFSNSEVSSIFALSTNDPRKTPLTNDNLVISLKFTDGSVGSVLYTSLGDTSYSKERVEIFGENSVGVIDNFQRTSIVRNGKELRLKHSGSDKGHKEELEAFIQAVKQDKPMPISPEEIINTTQATFKMIESLQRNSPAEIQLLNSNEIRMKKVECPSGRF
ncbi:MAG TPA: bi-domain-containing oxidoreductase [candidate division Zixibacteria bacterium]